MAAVATAYEVVPKLGLGGVESFSSHPSEPTRVRLTPDEARYVRYVLGEWSGDAGLGSSSSAQLERLAAAPHLLRGQPASERAAQRRIDRALAWMGQRWRIAWEKDIGCRTMTVHGGVPSHYRGAHAPLAPAERFCDKALVPLASGRIKRTEWGEAVRHAWMALRLLASARSESLVVLFALYGDRPPGMLDLTLWDECGRPYLSLEHVAKARTHSLNSDYLRVVKYVEASGGSAAALEAKLRVDRHRRDGESDEAYRSRLTLAQQERWALLHALGKGCERLIVDASTDYREACEDVS
jgi:hypothetical protein